MKTEEKVCAELCQEIFKVSSATDKTILSCAVNLEGPHKSAEVVLVTKENEYTFVLDKCSKCNSHNKYKCKQIKIKGYEVVELGKIDLEYLKLILEKLAQDHGRCIEEKQLEKVTMKTELIHPEPEQIKDLFLDILRSILDEHSEHGIDTDNFFRGMKYIEQSNEVSLKSDEDYLYVYGNLLQNNVFVKNSDRHRDYQLLNISTELNVPLCYDMLITIFSLTDQGMRQHFFNELLVHYYRSLKNSLEKKCLDVTKVLSETTFQRHVHKLLPYVKLQILKQYCQLYGSDRNTFTLENLINQHKRMIWELIMEVNECILYSNLSREDCYVILRNKTGSSDYEFMNYKVIPVSNPKGNLGDYFWVKTEIILNGTIELFSFFAKCLATNNDLAKDIAEQAFKKEQFYYLKFVPELNDLGLENITNFLPRSYFSRLNDILVLEDLSIKNYNSFSASHSYSYAVLRTILKQFAKMHACSILYEELLSGKTNEIVRIDAKFPEYVEEVTYLNTGESLVKKFFDCAIRTFLNMITVFPDIPKKMSVEEFQKRAKNVFDLSFEKIKKSNKFRNVICQGDSWQSNILFKDNLFTDCLIVDYQLIRYCPPAHDIYFLLYTATTKETRIKYESKLLQDYYSEVSNILDKHNVDFQKIYTFQEFLDCCNYMRSQGLCHAIMILQIVLFPEEKLKDIFQDKEKSMRMFLENRDIFVEELKSEGQYSQRMREFVEEMYEICKNICF